MSQAEKGETPTWPRRGWRKTPNTGLTTQIRDASCMDAPRWSAHRALSSTMEDAWRVWYGAGRRFATRSPPPTLAIDRRGEVVTRCAPNLDSWFHSHPHINNGAFPHTHPHPSTSPSRSPSDPEEQPGCKVGDDDGLHGGPREVHREPDHADGREERRGRRRLTELWCGATDDVTQSKSMKIGKYSNLIFADIK